jgi:hypothetical protein
VRGRPRSPAWAFAGSPKEHHGNAQTIAGQRAHHFSALYALLQMPSTAAHGLLGTLPTDLRARLAQEFRYGAQTPGTLALSIFNRSHGESLKICEERARWTGCTFWGHCRVEAEGSREGLGTGCSQRHGSIEALPPLFYGSSWNRVGSGRGFQRPGHCPAWALHRRSWRLSRDGLPRPAPRLNPLPNYLVDTSRYSAIPPDTSIL